MQMKVRLLLLFSYLSQILASTATVSTSSVCRSCLSSPGQHWCVPVNSLPQSGSCWALSDCSGQSCSDSSDLPEFGGLMLCPREADLCGTTEVDFTESGQSQIFSIRGVEKDSLWSYRIRIQADTLVFFNSIRIEVVQAENVALKVFKEKQWLDFEYLGQILEGANVTIRIGSEDVYIISEPSSDNNFINIKVTSEYDSSSIVQALILIGIIAGVLMVFWAAFLAILICYYNRYLAKRRVPINAFPGVANPNPQVTNAPNFRANARIQADNMPTSVINMNQDTVWEAPTELVLPPIRNFENHTRALNSFRNTDLNTGDRI